MEDKYSRLLPLFGEDAMRKLNNSHVAVFGIGGVGSYVAEALARGGIGEITLVDHDFVSESNINRQLVALSSTIGQSKVSVMASRIKDINSDIIVHEKEIFYLPETCEEFNFDDFDYVIDAVDTVTAKINLIEKCSLSGTPIISSMGTGNKFHPELFEVADIYSTSVCPLAKVMRHELKKRGIPSLKVVYSREDPIIKTQIPSSASFVPGVAGLILAGEAIKDLSLM